VRPAGRGRPGAVDLATRADVTAELRGPDGAIDLLARLGVPRADARRRLRLRADDLQVEERGDELVAHLAARPQHRLWRAAASVQDAEAWVAAEAARACTPPEDPDRVREVEHRHAAHRAAQARHEAVRHLAIVVGGACAIAAGPAALLVRWAALPFLVVALATTAVSVARRRRLDGARAAEREVLQDAGATSYRAFQLQRMSAVRASSGADHRATEAADAHRRALLAWRALVGDVDVDDALRLKARIAAALGGAGGSDDEEPRRPVAVHDATAPMTGAALARGLANRLARQAKAGAGSEALPLVLDEPFDGLAEAVVRDLLELVLASDGVQVILLTGDPVVAAWAQARLPTGRLAVLSPGPGAPVVPDRVATSLVAAR
jgi:hypothetical protein